jgi:hypothetical protein
MSAESRPAARQAFQFRIGTLLVAMAWAGLISLGLRTPTPLWSGVIAVLTLLTVLAAVLVIIYRSGRTRAMAIGFLVFCVGYLAYLAVLAGTLSSGLFADSTPIGGAFELLFQAIHPGTNLALFADVNNLGRSGPIVLNSYQEGDFIAICNHALACLLGVAGAIAAQVLHATRKDAAAE